MQLLGLSCKGFRWIIEGNEAWEEAGGFFVVARSHARPDKARPEAAETRLLFAPLSLIFNRDLFERCKSNPGEGEAESGWAPVCCRSVLG